MPAHTALDPREIARRLGTLSIEERVQIIKSLLDAGPSGQQMAEIAISTGLGVPAVYKQLEALIGAEMVNFRSVDNNKVYCANVVMLNELFDFMLTHYGPPLPTAEAEAEEDSE